MDNMYPPHRFSSAVHANIAFSSLPEGEFPVVGVHTYSWRIPLPSPPPPISPNQKPPDPIPPGGDGYLHGYVWFVQERVSHARGVYDLDSCAADAHRRINFLPVTERKYTTRLHSAISSPGL